MATEVFIHQKKVLDSDDKRASALIPKGTTGTKLVFDDGTTFLRTRNGYKARLAFVGNAVDAGGESFVVFTILINGNPVKEFRKFQQALGETFDPQSRMAVPTDLPQMGLVEVIADNTSDASTGTDYNAFIRLRVEYEEP